MKVRGRATIPLDQPSPPHLSLRKGEAIRNMRVVTRKLPRNTLVLAMADFSSVLKLSVKDFSKKSLRVI